MYEPKKVKLGDCVGGVAIGCRNGICTSSSVFFDDFCVAVLHAISVLSLIKLGDRSTCKIPHSAGDSESSSSPVLHSSFLVRCLHT
jgi:hypothetical protein